MNLEKAIKILKANRDVAKHRADGLEKNKLTDFLDIQYKIDKEDYEAIDTVLKELDTSYNKGYQDGFKQAKFEVEMDNIKEGK